MRLVLAIAALLSAAALFAFDERASATTFCVPTFGPNCPNSGGNVAESDLEKAMGLNAGDGVADTIVVAAGTRSEDGSFEPSSGFKNPGVFEPAGTDPLTVVGAGAGSTILTSAGTGNIYLVSLGSASGRAITMEDLTLQAPASFEDGGGAVIQLFTKDVLKDVDIVNLNKGTDGVAAAGLGNLVSGVEMRSGGTGTIGDAFSANTENAVLTVEDSLVEGASWGLVASSPKAQLTARRVTEIGTTTYGGIATGGGALSVENSVISTNDGVGFYVGAVGTDSVVTADHVTAVNSGPATSPALEVRRLSNGAGTMTMNVSNSILRGYESGYDINTTQGPGIGVAALTVRYSNLQGGGTTNASTPTLIGDIDTDPLFNSDLSLPATSPSVDRGDPAAGGLATDFLGAPRPNDGDGDGLAIRDQGAFEYQRPVPPGTGGGGEGTGSGGGSGGGSGRGGTAGAPTLDLVAPRTKLLAGPGKSLAAGKVKFRFASNEAGSRFECKLDKGKVRPCSSPKSYSGLRAGLHLFKVWAIDPAGNRAAKPAKRGFLIPA